MPTKPNDVKPPVVPNSMSDALLHFLYMFSKTHVYGYPTADKLFEINSPKYKKKDNLDRALSRLMDRGFISSFFSPQQEQCYALTNQGFDAIYKLALHRRRKQVKSKSRAGSRSAEVRWDED